MPLTINGGGNLGRAIGTVAVCNRDTVAIVHTDIEKAQHLVDELNETRQGSTRWGQSGSVQRDVDVPAVYYPLDNGTARGLGSAPDGTA